MNCRYCDPTLMMIAAILGVGFIWAGVIVAKGQHAHPQEDAAIHEQFYMTWNRPNGGQNRLASCCNKQDCYPTEFKREGGTWFAKRREDGVWIAVPDGVLEYTQLDPRESPDGRNHVCMQPPGQQNTVFCAVLGAGG